MHKKQHFAARKEMYARGPRDYYDMPPSLAGHPSAWEYRMMDRRMLADPYYEETLRAQYRRRYLRDRLAHQYEAPIPRGLLSPRGYPGKPPWMHGRRMPKDIDEESVKDSFDTVIKEVEAKFGKENMRYPSQCLLLIGPPGSGKTTLGKCFQKKLEYNMMISLRDMCQEVMQKNKGTRFNIQPVTRMMVTKIFNCPKDQNTRLIIDDFSSISIARIIPYIVEYAKALQEEFPDVNHPDLKLKICALTCHKDVCVDRKLKEKMTGNYKSYSTLYKKFNKRSHQVMTFLGKFYQYDEIDSSDNLENVQIRSIIEIEKEKNGSSVKKIEAAKPIV